MSDKMLYGVLRMPYEMAMADELSRLQFYQRAQEAADRLEAAEARNAAVPAAPAGQQDATDWVALARRLYVELFHCHQQMMSETDEHGEPLWLPGVTVPTVLADAKAALEVATRSRAQGGNTNDKAAAQAVPEGLRNAVYMALHYYMSVQNPDEWGATDKAIEAMRPYFSAAPKVPTQAGTPTKQENT